MKCTKPCKECPYLKTALSGYFGDNDPKYYYLAPLSDVEVVTCHKTLETDEEQPCRGALSFAANALKLPRDTEKRELVKLVGKLEDVMNPQEFVDHHNLKREDIYN